MEAEELHKTITKMAIIGVKKWWHRETIGEYEIVVRRESYGVYIWVLDLRVDPMVDVEYYYYNGKEPVLRSSSTYPEMKPVHAERIESTFVNIPVETFIPFDKKLGIDERSMNNFVKELPLYIDRFLEKIKARSNTNTIFINSVTCKVKT